MDTHTIRIETGASRGTFDVTGEVSAFVAGKGDGLVSVFVPHATAGIAIIETGAGSDADLMDVIDAILPRGDDRYRHRHGSEGHGADHVLPALVSPSVTIPVVDGRLALGTWQSVLFVDPNPDNPSRTVRLSFIAG
ncbi:MAG: secondary thiamine-phosphate synthase enzyme YjbQ [Acidimicrobiia bacterium]|nr:MAG: secondary thiamine-phosphate synthase enzyme YjbQ [Acidimicrobiia bacterium]